MRTLMNLIPLAFLLAFLLFMLGWQLFGWSLTTLLPYSISALFLCIASLNWNGTKSGKIKKVNAALLILTIILSFGLIFRLIEFKDSWETLIYSSIIGSQLLFINMNERSGIRVHGLIAYAGIALVIVSLICALFDMNFLLMGVIGLMFSCVLTVFQLISGFKK